MLPEAVIRFSSDSVCDMLCTSGFVDDVIFSHNGRVWHVICIAQDKFNSRDPTKFCSTIKTIILTVNCILGTKSAIYDFVVF